MAGQENDMRRRSTVGRIFGAIWTGVDGVRKVLHLLLLLFIFSIVLGALSASAPELPSISTCPTQARTRLSARLYFAQ